MKGLVKWMKEGRKEETLEGVCPLSIDKQGSTEES
jgi:hypothetical protein